MKIFYPSVDAVTIATFPSKRLHFIVDKLRVTCCMVLAIEERNIMTVFAIKNLYIFYVSSMYFVLLSIYE